MLTSFVRVLDVTTYLQAVFQNLDCRCETPFCTCKNRRVPLQCYSLAYFCLCFEAPRPDQGAGREGLNNLDE